MRYRWLVFALIVGALAFVAAGCGGGDDDGGTAEGSEDVTGDISVMAIVGRRRAGVAPGRDRRLQRALPERQRQVHVGRRQPRAVALDRGRGRQPARHRGRRPARADAGLRRAGRAPVDRRPPRDDRGQLRRIRRGRRRGRRDAVRDHVQGGEQVDHLVQRRVLRGGGRGRSRDLGGAERSSRHACRPQGSPRTRSASTSAGR